MKKIYQYILMAVAMIATASCSNDLDEALQSADSGNLQFVVSNFPAFGEGAQTRAIGLQDEGKTSWENDDIIFIHLYSSKYGNQAATLTFKAEDATWISSGTLSYLENENPTITAVYAPDCEISENEIVLKDNQVYGMAEYILANTNIADNTLQIKFSPGRTYSRLRIAATADASLTVTTTGFTPTGPEGATVPESYTLTADDKGNAYLYGTFAKDGSVEAETSNNVTKNHTFDSETEGGKSYALAVKLGDITDADDASTGDVALTDGSFVSNAKIAEMTDAQKAAMAGIVFWTTKDTDLTDESRIYPASLTDDRVMNADFPHCTHGLIVSLKNTETMAWQSSEEFIWKNFQSISDEYRPDYSDYVSIVRPETGDCKIIGYNNTKVLAGYNGYCITQDKTGYIVRPIQKLTAFSEQHIAPFGSTGWYLPSQKELHMLCYADVDNIDSSVGTEGKEQLNSILEDVNADKFIDACYWSSTENTSIQTVVYRFTDGQQQFSRKLNSSEVYSRYVCAF